MYLKWSFILTFLWFLVGSNFGFVWFYCGNLGRVSGLLCVVFPALWRVCSAPVGAFHTSRNISQVNGIQLVKSIDLFDTLVLNTVTSCNKRSIAILNSHFFQTIYFKQLQTPLIIQHLLLVIRNPYFPTNFFQNEFPFHFFLHTRWTDNDIKYQNLHNWHKSHQSWMNVKYLECRVKAHDWIKAHPLFWDIEVKFATTSILSCPSKSRPPKFRNLIAFYVKMREDCKKSFRACRTILWKVRCLLETVPVASYRLFGHGFPCRTFAALRLSVHPLHPSVHLSEPLDPWF